MRLIHEFGLYTSFYDNFKRSLRSGRIAQLHAGLLFALEEVGVQVQISAWLLAGFFSFFFFEHRIFTFWLILIADPF